VGVTRREQRSVIDVTAYDLNETGIDVLAQKKTFWQLKRNVCTVFLEVHRL